MELQDEEKKEQFRQDAIVTAQQRQGHMLQNIKFDLETSESWASLLEGSTESLYTNEDRILWDGTVKQLVDWFLKGAQHMNPVPLHWASWLWQNFRDKNGQPFNLDTLRRTGRRSFDSWTRPQAGSKNVAKTTENHDD